MGVLVICILVLTEFYIVCTAFFVLFILCILILIHFVCIIVRTTATQLQLVVVVAVINTFAIWTLFHGAGKGSVDSLFSPLTRSIDISLFCLVFVPWVI